MVLMLIGKIDGHDFSIEWKDKKPQVKTTDGITKYIITSSRRVRVYDPYMSTTRHADMLHSEWDAWLILNRMNGEGDIKLDITRTDISYESEYAELPEKMEQTKIIDS